MILLALLAAITLDTSVCPSGTVTNCTTEHVTGTAAYTAGTSAPISVPTSLSCAGSGTVLYAHILDESHAFSTVTGVPVIAAGTAGNYSTQWTLVSGTSVASTNGGAATYRAVCASSFSGEVPKLTLSCTGGTSTCQGTNGSVNIETFVQFIGFSTVFPTPGNTNQGNSASGTPSLTLTTTAGDKLLMAWADFSSISCTQTLTSGAAQIAVWETPGALNVGCNGGNDDYFFSEWTSGTTSAGSTTIGVTSPTNARGVWTAVEVCDSTASACPNVVGGTVATYGRRSTRGAGQ